MLLHSYIFYTLYVSIFNSRTATDTNTLSILTAIFQVNLSPFSILLELRVMEVVVTTRTIRRAKLQTKCHHQQTYIHLFTGRMSLHYITDFLRWPKQRTSRTTNQQCHSTEGTATETITENNNRRAPWKNRTSRYISFFRPSLSGVLFPMFCLLVEGKCQILVFWNIIS